MKTMNRIRIALSVLLLVGAGVEAAGPDSLRGADLRAAYIGEEKGPSLPKITLTKKRILSHTLQVVGSPNNVGALAPASHWGSGESSHIVTVYYYSIGQDDARYKVSFLGENLAGQMKVVPAACAKMKTYKTCQLTSATMATSGGALAVGSLIATVKGADEHGIGSPPPVMWIGAGVALSAVVPRYFARRALAKAVWLYNVNIISSRTNG